MMALEIIKELRDKIKTEGFSSVVVGLAARIDTLHCRINQIESDMEEIKLLLNQTQSNLSAEADEIVMSKIRSIEGVKLVKFETEDIYAVNRHIERLERSIAEIKSKRY